MLIGHKNPETGEFYTPNVEPYTEYKLSSRINYNNEILGREVLRRHRLQGIPGYHQLNTNRWVTEELISTLIANPIKDEDHRDYIIKKEKEVREIIRRSNQEAQQMQLSKGKRGKTPPGHRWNLESTIRLMHALILDEIKEAYLERYSGETREEFDGRNSANKPPSVEQVIADQINDPDWKPDSFKLGSLHQSFKEELDLSYQGCVKIDVTEKKVRDKLADLKVRVMKIMRNFEKSGNGDGMLADGAEDRPIRDVTDPNFGKWEPDRYKNDHRGSFLGDNPEECLYMWYIIDQYDLIQSTIATVDEKQGANSEKQSVTEDVHNKRDSKKSKHDDDDENSPFVKSIRMLSYAELMNTKHNLSTKKDKYELQLFDLDPENGRDKKKIDFLNRKMLEIEDDIGLVVKQMEKIK